MAVATHLVVVSYSDLPYSDAWTEVSAAVQGEGLLSPRWLWEQHNEHRLVLPKLFLAADLRWFRCRQVFPLAGILVIQLAHLVLLGWSMRVFGGWRGTTWNTGVGMTALCFFCPSQWENFVWPFQTSFVLPGFFATLSFVGLLLCWTNLKQDHHKRAWFLVLSIAAALAAQFSLANGNLLWPLLVAASAVLGLGRWKVLAYTLSGAISTFFFFHGYVLSSDPGRLATSIASPARLCEFSLAYLGSAWTNKVVPAIIIGGCGLALGVILAWYLRKIEHSRALLLLITLSLLFCLGTAALTAFGRLHFGLEQAFASRYQTPALLFWGETGLLLLLAAGEKRRSLSFLLLLQLCVVLVFARGAYLARYPIRQARWHGFQLNAAGAALMTGVHDPSQFYYAAVDLRHIAEDVSYLRQRRLSVFAEPAYTQLGKPLLAGFRQSPGEDCIGAWQSVTPLQEGNGVRISGWAWDPEQRKAPSYIVVVRDGTIIGLGAIGDWRPTIRAANAGLKSSFVGFTAYARDASRGAPISIYAVLHGQPEQACYITTIQPSQWQ
ncbi:MAG: hypothetical protein ACLPPV_05335 [Candidatus Korobacteraceae bacterium]